MYPVKLHQNSFIARMAAYKLKEKSVAITVGHHIFLYGADREDFLNNKKWVCHELAHIAQYRKYGLFRFIFLYLHESIRNGYNNNRFEVEARDKENDISLLNEYEIM